MGQNPTPHTFSVYFKMSSLTIGWLYIIYVGITYKVYQIITAYYNRLTVNINTFFTYIQYTLSIK